MIECHESSRMLLEPEFQVYAERRRGTFPLSQESQQRSTDRARMSCLEKRTTERTGTAFSEEMRVNVALRRIATVYGHNLRPECEVSYVKKGRRMSDARFFCPCLLHGSLGLLEQPYQHGGYERKLVVQRQRRRPAHGNYTQARGVGEGLRLHSFTA